MEEQQPPAQSPFISSSSSGTAFPSSGGGLPPPEPVLYPQPHEEEEEEEQEEEDEDDPEERRPWEEDDFGDSEVLDLTGGAGGFSHPPFTVCFPAPKAQEAPPDFHPELIKLVREEEERKLSWEDEVSESPLPCTPQEEEEVPPDRRPTAPVITPLAPLAPAPYKEEPVPRRGPSGSVVVDLLYWRDIKKTGVVFGASLFLLLSLTVFSIVSVSAYIALALLSVTISYRIYRGIFQAIQKSDDGHPFKVYLDSDVAVSQELVQKYSNVALGHVNCTIKELRRLFLVEDLVDSLKFAVLMWVLTYVGALFNGLTLLILALIALFSVPIIYERHQTQIDHYLGLVNRNVKDGLAKIQAKIPGLKPKAE